MSQRLHNNPPPPHHCHGHPGLICKPRWLAPGLPTHHQPLPEERCGYQEVLTVPIEVPLQSPPTITQDLILQPCHVRPGTLGNAPRGPRAWLYPLVHTRRLKLRPHRDLLTSSRPGAPWPSPVPRCLQHPQALCPRLSPAASLLPGALTVFRALPWLPRVTCPQSLRSSLMPLPLPGDTARPHCLLQKEEVPARGTPPPASLLHSCPRLAPA